MLKFFHKRYLLLLLIATNAYAMDGQDATSNLALTQMPPGISDRVPDPVYLNMRICDAPNGDGNYGYCSVEFSVDDISSPNLSIEDLRPDMNIIIRGRQFEFSDSCTEFPTRYNVSAAYVQRNGDNVEIIIPLFDRTIYRPDGQPRSCAPLYRAYFAVKDHPLGCALGLLGTGAAVFAFLDYYLGGDNPHHDTDLKCQGLHPYLEEITDATVRTLSHHTAQPIPYNWSEHLSDALYNRMSILAGDAHYYGRGSMCAIALWPAMLIKKISAFSNATGGLPTRKHHVDTIFDRIDESFRELYLPPESPGAYARQKPIDANKMSDAAEKLLYYSHGDEDILKAPFETIPLTEAPMYVFAKGGDFSLGGKYEDICKKPCLSWSHDARRVAHEVEWNEYFRARMLAKFLEEGYIPQCEIMTSSEVVKLPDCKNTHPKDLIVEYEVTGSEGIASCLTCDLIYRKSYREMREIISQKAIEVLNTTRDCIVGYSQMTRDINLITKIMRDAVRNSTPHEVS